MKKICPKAAITEPRLTIGNESVTAHSILSHAPTRVRPAPNMIYIIFNTFKNYTYFKTVFSQNHDYKKVSWHECDQKNQGLGLNP